MPRRPDIRITISSNEVAAGKSTIGSEILFLLGQLGFDISVEDPHGMKGYRNDAARLAAIRETNPRITLIEDHNNHE